MKRNTKRKAKTRYILKLKNPLTSCHIRMMRYKQALSKSLLKPRNSRLTQNLRSTSLPQRKTSQVHALSPSFLISADQVSAFQEAEPEKAEVPEAKKDGSGAEVGGQQPELVYKAEKQQQPESDGEGEGDDEDYQSEEPRGLADDFFYEDGHSEVEHIDSPLTSKLFCH